MRATKREIFGKLQKQYDAVSSVKFADLTVGQRTILGAVAWQYGSNLSKATPDFWKQTTSQDWDGALKNLRNFNDPDPSRRTDDADYLEQSMK